MTHENQTPHFETLEAVQAGLHELDSEHRIPEAGVHAILESMVDMPDGHVEVIDESKPVTLPVRRASVPLEQATPQMFNHAIGFPHGLIQG